MRIVSIFKWNNFEQDHDNQHLLFEKIRIFEPRGSNIKKLYTSKFH